MKFTLNSFPPTTDVRPGDAIATSSVSRLFPSGLPIGRVQSVNLEQALAPEAIIELTAPLDDIEWLVVHPNEAKQ